MKIFSTIAIFGAILLHFVWGGLFFTKYLKYLQTEQEQGRVGSEQVGCEPSIDSSESCLELENSLKSKLGDDRTGVGACRLLHLFG
jgi:hypothetical protein